MIRNNNQQNGRRRGRGGGQGGGSGGMPQRAPGSQNYGNNRLDIRQRGNATQLLDKYKTLARDAAQQGDRVASEYYLQYADHYFRVLNEIRERQPEHQRGPRPGYDADDEDADVGNGYNPGYNASNDGAQADNDRDEQQRYDNGQRGDAPRQYEARGNDDRPQPDRQQERPAPDRAQSDNRRDNARRDDQRQGRGDARGTGRGEYRDEQRRDSRDDNRFDAPRDEAMTEAPAPDRDEPPMLAGLPGPATLSPVAAAEPAAEEAPRRRRGRPRKVVDGAAADTVDA